MQVQHSILYVSCVDSFVLTIILFSICFEILNQCVKILFILIAEFFAPLSNSIVCRHWANMFLARSLKYSSSFIHTTCRFHKDNMLQVIVHHLSFSSLLWDSLEAVSAITEVLEHDMGSISLTLYCVPSTPSTRLDTEEWLIKQF